MSPNPSWVPDGQESIVSKLPKAFFFPTVDNALDKPPEKTSAR
jgi:hypothetical protein